MCFFSSSKFIFLELAGNSQCGGCGLHLSLAGSVGKPNPPKMWLGHLLVFCVLLMVYSSRTLRLGLNAISNGPGRLGSSECGNSGLLLDLPPSGDTLLATVENLQAIPYILCPVPLWCCQVGDNNCDVIFCK